MTGEADNTSLESYSYDLIITREQMVKIEMACSILSRLVMLDFVSIMPALDLWLNGSRLSAEQHQSLLKQLNQLNSFSKGPRRDLNNSEIKYNDDLLELQRIFKTLSDCMNHQLKMDSGMGTGVEAKPPVNRSVSQPAPMIVRI